MRFDTEVSEVDVPGHAVVLSSGVRLLGDVLIGADGENGRCRPTVLGRWDAGAPTGLAVYEYVLCCDHPKVNTSLSSSSAL